MGKSNLQFNKGQLIQFHQMYMTLTYIADEYFKTIYDNCPELLTFGTSSVFFDMRINADATMSIIYGNEFDPDDTSTLIVQSQDIINGTWTETVKQKCSAAIKVRISELDNDIKDTISEKDKLLSRLDSLKS